MVPRRSLVLIALALLGAAFAAVAGCGPDDPKPTPPIPRNRSTPKSVTFTQIEIDYVRSRDRPHITRTKDEARDLARKLVARIQMGESMDVLVSEYTDDRFPDGKVFNSGSYSKTRSQIANEAMRNAVFALEVGQLAPEPVDSGIAYHVLRRDL